MKTRPRYWRQLLPLPFAAAAALLLGACASGTNFANAITGYSGQARNFRQALTSADQTAVEKELRGLEEKCNSADRILYLQERGRIRSLNGDLHGSIADYQVASDAFENQRMKAVVSASDTFFAASSLASNDMAIPYSGYGFEKVMLHNMQALNYLLAGKDDFARIELNRADVEQTFSLEQHAKLAQEAEKTREKEQIQLSSSTSELDKRSSQAVFGATSVKNSFQNALTFYLRGSLYEDSRDWDKALIEYKKALDLHPSNPFVAQAAMRMAVTLGDKREQRNINRLHPAKLRSEAKSDGKARVVIVFERGFVRERSTFRLPFFWKDSLLQVALPFYDLGGYSQGASLELATGTETVDAATISNLDAMAVQSLKEAYPMILLRQLLRLIAKHKMQEKADEQGFGVLMKIANVVTDRADDRNWLTLPGTVQVAELVLPPGRQELNLRYMGLYQYASVELRAGETKYIVATQLGQRLLLRGAETK